MAVPRPGVHVDTGKQQALDYLLACARKLCQ